MDQHSSSIAKGAFLRSPWTVFRQKHSQNWFIRFSIRGQGQIRKSLQTPDEHEAHAIAPRVYYSALLRAEQGLEARDKAVSVLVEEWKEEGKLTAPELSALRYVIEFFGDMKPAEITYKTLTEFTDWRVSYWTKGPGKDIEFITYQRDGRTIRRPPTRKVPSSSTLKSEQVVLKKFLTWCQNHGQIKTIPKFEKIKGEVHNRPGFSKAELDLLISTLRKRMLAPSLTPIERYPHMLLFAYVGIMWGSGMRPLECQKLTWADLLGFEQCRTSPIGKGELTIRVHGKSKSREFVPLDGVIADFLSIWNAQTTLWGKQPLPSDLIFRNVHQKPIVTFNPEVVALLNECHLRMDYRGAKRTAYSFRHYYITYLLNAKVDIYDVARNCGTSVQMIEKFYSHVTLGAMRDRLRPEGSRL
ncbi:MULTISPECIES: tyrosine-type recombinase/integrase [Komagataeibacter]|uniref:tyrosine-type recombinase/integrase n=1 Tax=Komagataeibacter TaxID=1434011 RepID=UPI000237D829|nr:MULTISPECIES: site-specific integrase [Komagataeibacter]